MDCAGLIKVIYYIGAVRCEHITYMFGLLDCSAHLLIRSSIPTKSHIEARRVSRLKKMKGSARRSVAQIESAEIRDLFDRCYVEIMLSMFWRHNLHRFQKVWTGQYIKREISSAVPPCFFASGNCCSMIEPADIDKLDPIMPHHDAPTSGACSLGNSIHAT